MTTVRRRRPTSGDGRLRHSRSVVLGVTLALALAACSGSSSKPLTGSSPASSAASPGQPTTSPPGSPTLTTGTATTGTSASGTPQTGTVEAQAAVDRLLAAASRGDRTAWDAGVLASDASFAARSSVLYANLRTLRPSRLAIHLSGAEQQPPPDRQAALGPDARVLQGRLTWRLPGERSDATSTVWLTVVPGPRGPQLAGTDDGGSLDAPALPLWWLGPVTRATRSDVTVVVGSGQAGARWVGLAARAAADARTHLPRPLRRGWDGRLVVEVPASTADFARTLGAGPSAYARTAAVTRPEGPTTDAAVRVVVNPVTASQPDAELATTLTHEAVHVATRSAGSPAPLWAVEGLAEHVALEADPGQRRADLAALPARAPSHLPPDDAFTAGGQDVAAAYAQAWLVCQAVAEHRGEDGLGRFYAALDDGQPVGRAARSTLGVGEATVVAWWGDALRRATAAPTG